LLAGSIVFLFYSVTKVYCAGHEPVYKDIVSARFVTGYYIFNSAITFFMLFLFSILFVLEIKHIQIHLIREKEALDILASHDPLTKLLNRRSMEEHLNHFAQHARKSGSAFSVVLCDIDDFKKVNDTYGHKCGDHVLVHVANTIRSQVRSVDYVCRWGGEEILLLIRGDKDTATQLAEKIRQALATSSIMEDGQTISVTMTLGVAAYTSGCPINKLIQHADENLYIGKENGKNQVVS
jgi:diguanylate cyclase (GGDEF)-like protein